MSENSIDPGPTGSTVPLGGAEDGASELPADQGLGEEIITDSDDDAASDPMPDIAGTGGA